MAGSRPQPVLSLPRNRCSELSLLFHCVSASIFMPGPSLLFSHDHRRLRSQPQDELLSSVVTQISGKPGWAVDGAPSWPRQSLASACVCLWSMKWGKIKRDWWPFCHWWPSGQIAFSWCRASVAQVAETVPHRCSLQEVTTVTPCAIRMGQLFSWTVYVH